MQSNVINRDAAMEIEKISTKNLVLSSRMN